MESDGNFLSLFGRTFSKEMQPNDGLHVKDGPGSFGKSNVHGIPLNGWIGKWMKNERK